MFFFPPISKILFFSPIEVVNIICVCRWEEEYTARMDLQEKVVELEEVSWFSFKQIDVSP